MENNCKLQTRIKDYAIGVFVARLQVDELHEGHHYVIRQVTDAHKKVIIFLGVPEFIGMKKNVLDFDTRKKMVQEAYPNVVIVAIPDQEENPDWAHELDKRIREVYAHGDPLLYGSRDSFIPHYKKGGGKFDTKELEQLGTFAGTDIRKLISEDVKSSKDFRSGQIYHAYSLFPHVLPTVDIATLNEDRTKVLLARKYNKTKWRFIGGFVIPTDKSYELAAKRIYAKEAGGNSETGNYKYVTSCQIPDWRFRGEEDKVMTTLFTCKDIFGPISPSDDLAELKWFNISDLHIESTYIEDERKFPSIVTEHKELMSIFLKNLTA